MAYLLIVLRSLVLLMWAPAVVFAAAAAATGADAGPLNVPVVLVVATAIFSSLAGATTLALRLVSELRANPDKPLVAPMLFSFAHMLGSWCAGAFMFFTAMSGGYGVWTLLGMVLVGSFAGAKLLEVAAEKWLPTTLPKGDQP